MFSCYRVTGKKVWKKKEKCIKKVKETNCNIHSFVHSFNNLLLATPIFSTLGTNGDMKIPAFPSNWRDQQEANHHQVVGWVS